jgi:CRP-like cAMP-binding protein
MAIEDTLANVELFAELPRRDLSRLAKVTVVRDYDKGAVIVKEGELGVAFYVVAEGRVEVVKDLGTDKEQVVAEMGPDSFFGEMALFDNQVRSASVRAMIPTQCLVITKWDFNAELTGPGARIAIALLAVLARRIRALNEAAATH